MSGRIAEKTISDLKDHTQEIFDLVHRTGQPVTVTVNGKPDIVLLDAALYEKVIKSKNLATLLAEAELEIKQGNVRPARDFLNELKSGEKISG